MQEDMFVKVTLFMRNQPLGHSIENITKSIKSHMPDRAEARIFTSSFISRGLVPRIKAAWEARHQQGEVNHITGDVHYLTIFMTKKKTILTIHDCERLSSQDYGYAKKLIYKFFWFTLPAFRSAIITTISHEAKKTLTQYAGISENRIVVIPDGVDDRFEIVYLNQQDKNKLLHNDAVKKTVMNISDTKVNKNVARLIEALAGLDVKFIKVGGLTDEHVALLKRHRIDYHQFQGVDQDTLVKIYNSVDCLAFPSTVEGFGLPVVEAQRCGCPVVTSNVSSLPEVAGEGALLVDPYSIESIRQGIRDVLTRDDLRIKLVAKGFENAKRFKWSNIARQYYELYQEVSGF